jgi:hypothetical protein
VESAISAGNVQSERFLSDSVPGKGVRIMKTSIKIAGMAFVILLVSTYAAASKWMPEKYDLDHQLTKVEAISNTSYIGWEKVDSQSLVLQTSPSRYYLIVLSFPAFNLPFTEDIGITGMNLMTRPGYDNVMVREATGRWEKYIINKIYGLEDRKQAREIIAQLTGAPTIQPRKSNASEDTLLASGRIQFFRRF